MTSVLDRYTPSEPLPRLVLATALVTGGLPAALYGFFALTWPIQLWMYPGPVAAALALVGGSLALLAGTALARDVAGRVRESDRSGSRADGDEEPPESDPVSVLQRRYAAGELDEDEFERKVERLLDPDPDPDPEGAESATGDATRVVER